MEQTQPNGAITAIRGAALYAPGGFKDCGYGRFRMMPG